MHVLIPFAFFYHWVNIDILMAALSLSLSYIRVSVRNSLWFYKLISNNKKKYLVEAICFKCFVDNTYQCESSQLFLIETSQLHKITKTTKNSYRRRAHNKLNVNLTVMLKLIPFFSFYYNFLSIELYMTLQWNLRNQFLFVE